MRVRILLAGLGLIAAVGCASCLIRSGAGDSERTDAQESELRSVVPAREGGLEEGATASSARFEPSLRLASTEDAFPSEIRFDGAKLVLNGSGLCEWGVFGIDLYRAALYLGAPARDLDSVLETESPVVIHLHFVRSLTKDQLATAYSASVKTNTGDGFGSHEASLQELCNLLVSVDDGDSLTFVADLERRVEVLRNGSSLGFAGDRSFARLFVDLYLGDKPPTKALRRGLFGL